eukprot:757432-Hanusia_phi.AAC.2
MMMMMMMMTTTTTMTMEMEMMKTMMMEMMMDNDDGGGGGGRGGGGGGVGVGDGCEDSDDENDLIVAGCEEQLSSHMIIPLPSILPFLPGRTVNNIGRAWTLVATVDVTTSKGLPQISSPLLLTITSTSSVNAPGTCAMPASFGSIGPCTVIRLSTTCGAGVCVQLGGDDEDIVSLAGVDFTGEFLLEPDCQGRHRNLLVSAQQPLLLFSTAIFADVASGGSTFTQPRLGTQAT